MIKLFTRLIGNDILFSVVKEKGRTMKDNKEYIYRVVFETLNSDYTPKNEVAYDFDNYGAALDCYNAYDLEREHKMKNLKHGEISCKTLYECEAGKVFDMCDGIEYEEVQ